MAHSIKRSLGFSAALIALWLGLKLILPLILPFVLGAGLALAAEPAAKFLGQRCRLPGFLASALAVSALVAGLGLLALLLAALAVSQLSSLTRVLPALLQKVQSGVFLLQNWLLGLAPSFPQGLRGGYQEAVAGLFSGSTQLLAKISGFALGRAGSMLTRLPESAVTLGTALISAYMICAKLPVLRRWLRARIPPEKLAKWLRIWKKLCCAGKLWLQSQLKLMSITFCLLLCGFWLLGVANAPLIALITCLVDALPVLGTGTVLLPWAFLSFLGGGKGRALGLLVLYACVVLVRSVLEPKLVGSHLGLDPLVTLIAMYCGFRLWGLVGMLLLPLLAATAFQVLPEAE